VYHWRLESRRVKTLRCCRLLAALRSAMPRYPAPRLL